MSSWVVLWEGALVLALAPLAVVLCVLVMVALAYARRALFFLRFPPRVPVPLPALGRILVFETLGTLRILGWALVRLSLIHI